MCTVLYLEMYRHFKTGYDKERKEKEKKRKKDIDMGLRPFGQAGINMDSRPAALWPTLCLSSGQGCVF